MEAKRRAGFVRGNWADGLLKLAVNFAHVIEPNMIEKQQRKIPGMTLELPAEGNDIHKPADASWRNVQLWHG